MSERSEQEWRAPTYSLLAVLRIQDFRRLWVGLGLSSLGDWLGLLALTAMANAAADTYAGKNYAIATVLFLRVLPALVLGPIAGYVADRLDRRNVLIWGDFLRGALFLTIPLVGPRSGCCGGSSWSRCWSRPTSLVWGPAKDATVPNLVPRERLEAGQPDQPGDDVRLGAAGGGALRRPDAGRPGLPPSVVRLGRRRAGRRRALLQRAVVPGLRPGDREPARPSRVARPTSRPRTGVWSVIVDGWRYVGRTPVVRGLVIGITGAFAAGGVVVGLARTFVADLGGGDSGYGLLFGTVFAGLGLGMWKGPRLLQGLSPAAAVRDRADR